MTPGPRGLTVVALEGARTVGPIGNHVSRGAVKCGTGPVPARCHQPAVCHDPEMVNSGQMPLEGTEFKVRLNGRSFRSNILVIILLFLAYAAAAVFASGGLQLIGVAGATVFGVVGLSAGVAGARQIRRDLVVATLNDSGVTFRRHDPVGWEAFREVSVGKLRPRLLFALRPLHYIAFLPARTADLPRPRPREWLAIKMYGTNLLLMTETVTPGAEEILTEVERLSDVPIRR